MDETLKEFLSRHDVVYELHTHPAVFTCEEAERHCAHIPGLACKNLFIKDDKGRFYLVILPATTRLDSAALRRTIGASKTSFGNEEELMRCLSLTKGSVSPFGLVNDKERQVTVIIDTAVWEADIVSFHPNRNDETLSLSQEMMRKFFTAAGIAPKIMTIGV